MKKIHSNAPLNLQPSAEAFLGDLPKHLKEGALDLHCHSVMSDGRQSAEELFLLARAHGLRLISITDHDNFDFSERAQDCLTALLQSPDWGHRPPLTYIPGIEVSSLYLGEEVHLLCYFPEPPQGETFPQLIQDFQEERRRRNRAMCQRLRALQIPIREEELSAFQPHPEGSVGRPHIADWLVHQGYACDRAQAFDRYLLPGRPAYSPRRLPDFETCLQILIGAGGLPVLAHPCRYQHFQKGMDRRAYLFGLAQCGLPAIEVFHPSADSRDRAILVQLAQELGLGITAGSDEHGKDRTHPILYRCGQTYPELSSNRSVSNLKQTT